MANLFKDQAYIDFLLRTRFPDAFVIPSVSGGTTTSPSNDETNAAIRYRAELEALSPFELKARVAKTSALLSKALSEKAARDEQDRGFSRPETEANYARWAKMSYWTLDEGVALSLGREPKFAAWPELEPILNISPFAAEFAEQREILVRAKEMGQLWERTTPARFVKWAQRVQFELPNNLVAEVTALGEQVADWKTLFEQEKKLSDQLATEVTEVRTDSIRLMKEGKEHSERMVAEFNEIIAGKDEIEAQLRLMLKRKDDRIAGLENQLSEIENDPSEQLVEDLHPRVRETLLKMVIGMAIGAYSYDPTRRRNSAPREIKGDVDLCGLSIDEDTARKYLREGCELLPSDFSLGED